VTPEQIAQALREAALLVGAAQRWPALAEPLMRQAKTVVEDVLRSWPAEVSP
jgi:hypothetical protein